MLLALLLTLAACGQREKATGQDSSETPAQTGEPTDSGQDTPPDAQLRFDVLPTAHGEHTVSDRAFIFFTVSDDEPTSFNRGTDGLYRAELSMENPVRLARGECRSLTLDGESLYFILEDESGVCPVCSVDKQGTALRRIVRDVAGAESLSIHGG